MKTALLLRHLSFEHVGVWQHSLEQRGFVIEYVDAPRQNMSRVDVESPDLLIALGGPVGVHDADRYPFLHGELELVKRRLATGRPLLGICLGAQQIAHALGASVGKIDGPEIGFAPLTLADDAEASPLAVLGDWPVLHWHGEGFALPPGAKHLAATDACPHQAFAIGSNVLGLQFHLEVDGVEIEDWLVGHCSELASNGIDPRTIRADAERYGPELRRRADRVLGAWIDGWQDGAPAAMMRTEQASVSPA
jgi:GMP synthase (glutamine-hydrolysing)